MRSLKLYLIPLTAALLLAGNAALAPAQDVDEIRGAEIRRGLDRVAQLLELIERTAVKAPAGDELVDAAIRGMLAELDPHSSYFGPELTQDLSNEQQGEYFGVGLTVGLRDGRIMVVSPMEGGPAHSQGIRTGDIITHIDGIPATGDEYDASVRRLRGPQGTSVRITIEREGLPRPITVTVVRDRISLRTVSHSFMIDADTGYVRLTSFAQTSDREVSEAIDRLKAAGMRRLVFDLRGNPGGDLDASVGVANLFVPDGLIVYIQGLTEDSRQDYRALSERAHFDGPMVVLINNGSASGSEVVTGALQDLDRAWVVGEKSWGKGLVQTHFPLSYGASLSLTTAKYYTPSGRLIQRPYRSGAFDDYFNPTAETGDNLLEPARTSLGRIVYGGNGIAPDTVSRIDPLTPLSQQILLRGLIFTFVNSYLNQHLGTTAAFRADDAVMADFRAFVTAEELEVSPEHWEKDDEYLRARITQEVVNRIAGADAAYEAILAHDRQLQEALKQFGNAEELLRRRLMAQKH